MPKPKKPTRAAASTKPKAKSTLPAAVVGALPTAIQFMKHIGAAAELISVLTKEMAQAKKGGSISVSRAFVTLHRMIERTDELLKPSSDLFNDYKTAVIPELFQQDGVTNIPLDEGFRVGLSMKFVASIKPGERDKAYKWLQDNELGDIIQGTVNSGTLTAAAKKLMEEKNVELPSELFNTAFLPNVSVTKTK